MNSNVRLLLGVDAVINLTLGVLLLLYPAGLPSKLGLPIPNSFFYTSILGGVIFGIGLALGLEWRQGKRDPQGLGLAGAISINLCGGGVLLYWLIMGNLTLPLGGSILLWIVAILVLGIGLIELISGAWKSSK
jgi:hypothetical protein